MSESETTAAVEAAAGGVRVAQQRPSRLASLLFLKVERLVRLGSRRALALGDLPPLSRHTEAQQCFDDFLPVWEAELAKPRPSYARAIVAHFKWQWLAALALAALYQLLQLVGPFTIQFVTAWLADPAAPAYLGWVYLV